MYNIPSYFSIFRCSLWTYPIYEEKRNILIQSTLYFRSEKFCHWLKVFSEISNIHGMKWHLYVKKKPLKILCVLFIFFVIFAIPAILIYEALYFFSPVAINTALVLEKSDKMKYPNVTVCFAQFFDKTLLERKYPKTYK